MSFRRFSLAVVCGAVLLAGCGDELSAPVLPGPVQVSGEDFVSAQEYRFTPGSVLETYSLRMDFINPRYDFGIQVRDIDPQGSGEGRMENVEARVQPLAAGVDSDALSIQIAETTPFMTIRSFAPDDALQESYLNLGGLVLRSSNINDQRIRVGSTFSAQEVVGQLPTQPNTIPPTAPEDSDIDADGDGDVDGDSIPDPDTGSPVSFGTTTLTFRVENIYVSNNGTTVVLEGSASLLATTTRVLNTVTGSVLPDPPDFPTVIFDAGRFSAAFVVAEAGVGGDGSGEDPLALLARLNFEVNQAELLSLGSLQTGVQSILFVPDPARHPDGVAVLPNQLVEVRRLLDGRVQAEFDPANPSTVVNFTQVNPPPAPFPTPIPQLDPPPTPAPPTTFNYFFSMRTERVEDGGGTGPVLLEGLVPVTGDFIFRSLGGSQLAGPFNGSDIGGGEGRGNLVMSFSQDTGNGLPTDPNYINGEFQIEQEYPTENVGTDPGAAGTIVIIRGFFNGPQVNL